MRRMPVVIPALCLAACAAQPSSGGRVFSLVTGGEERNIGFSAAEATLQAEGLYEPASGVTRYVKNVCEKVFAVTEAPGAPLQCDFIDDGEFNAFATPGYLLVNRGLLPFLNSEEELASVIGHESGHLMARHTVQALTRLKLGGLANGLLVGASAEANNPLVTEAVLNSTVQTFAVTHMAFTRVEETEADALARRYMEKAGYDARESVNAARAMRGYDLYTQKQLEAFNNGKPETKSIFERLKSSHPATQERVEEAVKAAGEPVAGANGESRRRYMSMVEGLPWGPAHRYGIARKNELVLTQQRTVIPLPEGATTAYVSSHSRKKLGTWLVGHPQSGTYFTLTSLKLKSGHSPAWLLQTLLPTLHEPVERMKFGQAEREATGYTATYRYLLNEKRYRMVAVPASYPVDEMLLITIVYPDEATWQREDAGYLAALQKMHFLTKDAAEKYQQLRLHIFTAANTDSVAGRAARLPVGALQEDLFRALNNLPEGQNMKAGETYKTIVDPNR